MITVQDLTKKYTTGSTELTVLKNINFSIQKGEFVAIVGKSGSGKSTLLYQMSLLDLPTSGNIVIDGINTKTFSEEARVAYRLNDLGYVFQEYALIPSLTALENVMAPFMMRGLSEEKAKKQAMEVLGKVGLEGKINNLPAQLSGGQQQRVSIARAIGHAPKILYADEPTANLDTVTSKQVLSLFIDLHKSGQTIIMVTHEDDYAKLAGRIITLADGSIVSDTHNKLPKAKKS
ncbi:ABC transporter ATP-binding protein [Candidatus Woesebacteria bacterium]|nr:ABC transporter ATP-binding protein [Candidatus Woesebacteria bacterium]